MELRRRQGEPRPLCVLLSSLVAFCCLAGMMGGCAAAGRGAELGHDAKGEGEDAGVGPAVLTMSNFNSSMAQAEAPYMLCEFFASWCPACMNFKPQYEKVGRLFNAAPTEGAFVYVAAVDCATETALCQHFKVDRYPTMLWGEPARFAANLQSGGDPRAGLEPVEVARSAEAVLAWINDKTQQSFSLTSSPQEHHAAAAQARVSVQQERASQPRPLPPAQLWDIEEATALAFHYMLAGLTPTPAAGMRPNVSCWTHLVAEHHPSARCRSGAASLVAQLDHLWPVAPAPGMEELLGAPVVQLDLLQQVAVCGAGIPRADKGSWRSCLGSTPNTRGYSCGLWQLFHSLSVRLDAGEGRSFLAAVRGFVDWGFPCDECRRHFLEASSHPDAAAAETRRDAVLWVWAMHNRVNTRLARTEDESGAGDPAFPKVLWPTRQGCPQCRKSPTAADKQGGEAVQWDEEAVYRFLTRHYRQPAGDNPGGGGLDRERPLGLPEGREGGREWQAGRVTGAVLVLGCVGAVGWWWQGRRRRRKVNKE